MYANYAIPKGATWTCWHLDPFAPDAYPERCRACGTPIEHGPLCDDCYRRDVNDAF